ncbi:MAG: hypothetical protein GX621_08620, partial [Pirellulaceae bacterium]|nr:hypothetical protein [Pirellulaceae bacterium]
MATQNSEPNAANADIVALAQQYLDGQLTPAQESLLSDRLRLDARARTLFVRNLLQTAHLHELLVQQRSTDGTSGPTEASGRSAATGAAPLSPAPIQTPVADDDSSASGFGLTQLRDWLTGWNGVGLVAFGAILAAAMLLMGRGEDVRLADQPSPQHAAAAAPSQAEVAEVFDPRSIRLDAGSARVTLPKVGYMLVDGPA